MNKPSTNTSNPSTGLPLAGMLKNPFENATGALYGWMRYAGCVQNEAIGFVQARFRRDVEALERFARCRRPEEYVDAQAKFIADLYSDYAKESVKIAGLLTDAAQRAREEFAELGVKSSWRRTETSK